MSEPRSPLGQPLVELNGVTVRYGEVTALDRAELVVPNGGLTAVVGESGCGKTTLLRVLAGFETPEIGSVFIAGRCVAGRDDAGARRWVPPERRRVSVVFQEGALFPHLTVAENVGYGIRDARLRRDRTHEMLTLVGLADRPDRLPHELSGGQQQRVALARALAPDPRLVLLDEPFASLDENLRERVRDEVRSILRAAGATAVLVTHDQAEALSLADWLAVMAEGRVLQCGSPEEVYRSPASPQVARFLGQGQLLPASVAAGVLRCAFGERAVARPDAEGLVLVRPEDLELRGPGDEGLPGLITGRRFYGHDLLDEVRVEGDHDRPELMVRTRSLAPARHPVGARVRVALREGELLFYGEPATGNADPAG
ncbi:MAG TPA: ABC transporter ATP-binding protein [Thermoanaerobaculia bacterium]|nr:ABC transporter ATP-binding protein [Thermoanaerobaculia bacterium]